MRKLFGLGFIVLFLSGCATTGVKFDPVANRNLRTIGVVEISNPAMQVIESTVAEQRKSQLGLLPLLVLAAGSAVLPIAQKEAEGILTKEISDSGFNFGRQMTEELAKALQKANYEVIVVSPNEKNTAKMDAYLSIGVMQVGYRYADTSGNEVVPVISQAVRLTSRLPTESTGDVFYSSAVIYGQIVVGSGYGAAVTTTIPVPMRHHFDLTKPENKPLIIEGLQVGITAIAEKVAADLRK